MTFAELTQKDDTKIITIGVKAQLLATLSKMRLWKLIIDDRYGLINGYTEPYYCITYIDMVIAMGAKEKIIDKNWASHSELEEHLDNKRDEQDRTMQAGITALEAKKLGKKLLQYFNEQVIQ